MFFPHCSGLLDNGQWFGVCAGLVWMFVSIEDLVSRPTTSLAAMRRGYVGTWLGPQGVGRRVNRRTYRQQLSILTDQ